MAQMTLKSPKLSLAQVIHNMGYEPQVRSLSRFMWEYLQTELTRGHIIDQNTVQDAIESWASQHASD